jgi:hypothetical protein
MTIIFHEKIRCYPNFKTASKPILKHCGPCRALEAEEKGV